MADVGQLIDYLSQFGRNVKVFRSSDDVEEPCEFVDLNTALTQIDNE